MVTWLLIAWHREKKPSMTGALTGAVAGLACVTPAAGYVEPRAAAVIGLIAGTVCYSAVVLRGKLGWDDALDVWGCHGIGGVLGLIEGNVKQFAWQCAAGVSAAYSFAVTFVTLKVINVFTRVRVPEEVEEKGLDEALHGEKAYDLVG